MAATKEVLVATVAKPGIRLRIPKEQFDAVNAKAEEQGLESPYIVQEEGCEGGKSYDQLTDAGKKKVITEKANRQARLDEEAEEE